MNCSTTFRGLRLVSLMLAACILLSSTVYADEAIERKAPLIPLGDILVVYSDGASDAEIAAVSDIVEILTYQSFQVSYGTATQAAKALDDFDYVICYEVDKYPKQFLTKLSEGRERGLKLFFIGSQLIRDFMQSGTDLSGYTYVVDDKKVGKVSYAFDSSSTQEGLVKEDGFLFFTKGMQQESGVVEAGEHTGYVIANNEQIAHMTIGDLSNNLVKAIFAKEVAKWKWPYDSEEHVYAQYIVLNEVYPFQDPDKLLEIVNLLVKEQEPFVISVMPVYVNADYPAMQKFCEILRYAQANGGAIILHAPLNQKQELDAELINEYMTIALRNYMDQKVYPIGVQVPVNWMFDQEGVDVLSRFSTVFTVEEEDTASSFSEDLHTNSVYEDGHQWVGPAIGLDNTGVSYTKVYSTAVYINFTEEADVITDKIHACQDSFVPLKSLWDVDHTFWSDEDLLLYKNGILTVNSIREEKTYQPSEQDEEFQYNRNTLKRFSRNLAEENRKLVVVVVVVSVLFIFFLYSARHNNKKRFFYSNEEQEKKEEK